MFMTRKFSAPYIISGGVLRNPDPFSGGGMPAPSAGGMPGMPSGGMQGGQGQGQGQGGMPTPSNIVPGMTVTPPKGMDANEQAAGGQPQGQNGGDSPLAKYAALVDNKGNKGQQGQQGQQQQQQAAFDPLSLQFNDFATQASKLDFTRGINPEDVNKALAGDAQALMSILNVAARNAFASASHAGTQITGNVLNNRFDSFKRELPNHMREYGINNEMANIAASEPNWDNPVLKPMIDSAIRMFKDAYPNSTPQQITTMAREYIKDASSVLYGGGQGGAGEQPSGMKANDMGDFFDTM